MYGIVLMAAMAGGAETPALFNKNKGCSGCYGTVSYACSGHSCSGCSGYVPSCGCSGRKGLFGKKHKGCSGCSGCSGYVSCHGCYGGHVSCYGGHVSCYGAPAVSYAPAVGCHGGPVIVPGAPIITQPAPGPKPMPGGAQPPVKEKGKGKEIEKLKKPPVDNETTEAAPARITITVPGDARVSIDGAATTTTDTTRTFESPTLVPGKSYTYTFQAEFVRDGKNVVVTREVKVRAGVEVEVSLENETAIASR